LDAKLNAQIIESIFLKQSPVHDGAIIIRGNRIKRVGTFLPLTQKEGLSRYYGSRHRAAIGLSEVSDALVLVVSEERGDVSLVRRGKVELMRDPQQLQDELGRLLLGTGLEKEAQQRTRAWLAYAGGLLLTLLLVSTVWGIYTGGQLSLISITAPIDFRNIPENLELKKASAEKVKVQITGKRRLINALKPEQVRAFLDLQETNQGVRRMSLNRENIEVPLGLELVRASPSTIRLELEQRVEKKVAVKPEIAGILPAGYQIEKISVSPKAVKISGPKSTLRAIKTLNTEQVDLGKMETLEGKKVVEVPLVISPASLRLVPGQPREVQLYIQFASKKPTPDQLEERKTRYHEVRAGETLWGISRRYGLTIDELRLLNELAPGTVIYPGQNLKLGPANRE
jgi:LysM repeat protein